MKFVQGFNLFPKLQDKQYSKSTSGGILFLISIIVIILLIIYEIVKQDQQLQLSLDDWNTNIKVKLNITINSPCAALQLDLKDMTGLSLQDVQHTIQKIRINNGQLIPINQLYTLPILNTSCYGAEIYDGQQCYTCQDVMIAFSSRRWALPNSQTIQQCVPIGNTVLPFDNYQIEYQDLIKQQQDETLQNIQLQLSDLNITDVIDEDEAAPLKEIMTQDQKDKFKQALSELSEITYNPMQWDEKRLKSEKGIRVESLINMLNISLDSIGNNLASQIRFADRERVISSKNLSNEEVQLTEIYRQKCENHIQLLLNLTYSDQIEQIKVDLNATQCTLPIFYYANKQQNTSLLEIDIRIGENNKLKWLIGENHTLLNTFMINIEKITVLNEDYDYIYEPQGMLDKAYSQFRVNIYVPMRRVLFTDSFSVEQGQDREVFAEEVAMIEEHINESCQFYGYFYLKRVPGTFTINSKNELLQYVKRDFQANHSINELEFNGFGYFNQKHNGSANYYIKLVSHRNINIWNEENQFYKYTIQKSDEKQEYPRIVFSYEFDPIAMTYRARSINEYIVGIFAVIGGVFALSKYIASVIWIIK